MKHTRLEEYLYQFIGDISFTGEIEEFRCSLNRSVIFTPGVRHVAETGRAYWLIHAIALYLTPKFLKPFIEKDPRIGDMHFWKLTIAEDRSALLEARADSDCEPFVRQEIPCTDFPLRSIEIWAAFIGTYWTLYLPGEY